MSDIRFDDRVVLITGAGTGLGRSHASAFARRGAKVVVNDFGGDVDGSGGSSEVADAVAKEIRDAGGQALSHGADVTNPDQVDHMVQMALAEWGRVDVLVNNAGILRDTSFAKMTIDDFRKVLDVHLTGSAVCTKAVWPVMRDAAYGRIVMTTSTSGIYGNFGQANYGAAKMGLVGLMNVLAIEGAKYDIRVNCLCPAAATRMTEDIFPEAIGKLFTPESVTPGAVYLASNDAPNRAILNATGGGFSRTYIEETKGTLLSGDVLSPEGIAEYWDRISDRTDADTFTSSGEQVAKFAGMAMAKHKSS